MGAAIDNDDLLRFADGALDDAGRVRVLTHLASRPAAIERVEAYLEQNARLRDLRRHLPMVDSRSFAPLLQDALVTRLTATPSMRRRYGPAVAAALALVLVTGVIGYETMRMERTGGERVPISPGQSATAPTLFPFGAPGAGNAPASGGATMVAATADDNAAFDWLEAHVSDFSLSAPALDRIGLSLVGSETMQTAGMPVIRVGYRDAADRLFVLYAGVTRADAALAFRPVGEGQLSMQWRHGPMIFALVAPTNSPQLSDVVDLVGEAVARIAVPERTENAQMPEAEAAAGAVQAIAVPLARPEPAPGPNVEATDPVVDPTTLGDPMTDNEPKPL